MRNLKKVISSVAALAIVASSASAFAISFPDVDASASYANAVSTLTGLGVINGDDAGLFNPENSVTRAEFTKMAVEALGEGDSAKALTTSQFNDAANTDKHWAAGYIQQGVTDGFINGYDDTTFGPDDQVTYAQALKMLVAAIGYTTYAENQGGYPAGYVAQAVSLNINTGVSANNDTALTRAQCAVLIYNAMKAPLCVVDGWENVSTLTGVSQQPVLKKLDGKEGRDYQNLLSYKHDAYFVKGRVMGTSVGADGLDKDEVKYDVEVADNYDDYINVGGSGTYYTDPEKTKDQIFKVGDTNAASTLFEYTEAIVQKDSDSDEYTLLSITQYGQSKIQEFNTDDVADDDDDLITLNGNTYEGYVAAGKLPVYKNSSSTSTTKYDLQKDNGVITAEIYVNGVGLGTVTDELITKYIINNPTGKVKLVDKTNTGSTSTDGYYDYLMVTFYVDAVVDSIQTSSTSAKVYFKNFDSTTAGFRASSMSWDPEDEDIDITITKDGEEIAYTDLEEYDVLSIAYNVEEAGDLDDLEYYDIQVSSDTVSGTVTSRDTDDHTVRVDGSDYEVVESLVDEAEMDLSTDYTLYLDVFGYVAHFDEGITDKNYGVIVAMYTSAGNDNPTVRMINSAAEVVAYETKDSAEANKFYSYATTGELGKATYGDYSGNGTSGFTKSEISNQIKAGNTVCTFTVTGGKVKFKDAISGYGGDNLEFKANSSKIGSYTISESVTKLIDMDSYMSDNSSSSVGTLSVSSFDDGATYTAYLFDKNSNGDYRFGIVFEGMTSIRPDSDIAVVVKSNGTTTVDGVDVNELIVAKGTTEGARDDITLLSEDSAAEGDIISYTIGTDGYVESGDLYKLYSPASSYANLLVDTLNRAAFTEAVKYTTETEDKGTKYAITYTQSHVAAVNANDTSKDVYVYFGPVYKKQSNNLELFLSKDGDTGVDSKTATVESFSVASANQFIYDYSQQTKHRVSVGSSTQTTSVFSTDSYVDGNGKNYLSWQAVVNNNISPLFAFVKEVDGDVTDVIYFIGELPKGYAATITANGSTSSATQTPATETPATEAPATEAPATEAPATEAATEAATEVATEVATEAVEG